MKATRKRAGKRVPLDRERLRAALRGLHRGALLDILDYAFDMIPDACLVKIAKGYFSPSAWKAKGNLLSDVKNFFHESLQGDYYESFAVDSKNFMEKSSGTEKWIVECERLFKRCAAEAARLDPLEARQAIESLFDLLRRVDEGNDDIVFWADEGGADEVGVDWDSVLPAWFRCLAATAGPEEYARETLAAIKDFVSYDRDRYLKKARAAATPAQKKALKSTVGG
jgi:hypothetical protein